MQQQNWRRFGTLHDKRDIHACQKSIKRCAERSGDLRFQMISFEHRRSYVYIVLMKDGADG